MNAVGRRSLSIRARLTLCLGLCAAITGGVGAVALWAFSRANAAFQNEVTQSEPALQALLGIARNLQQALVVERSLLFMSPQSEGVAEQRRVYDGSLEQIRQGWSRYRSLPAGDEERAQWPRFESALEQWQRASHDVLQLFNENTPTARREAIDLTTSEGAQKFHDVNAALDELQAVRERTIRSHAALEAQRIARLGMAIVATVGLAFVLAMLASVFLGRSIAQPLAAMVVRFRDIAEGEGDLTQRISVQGDDEIGQLATWFNAFAEKIQLAMQSIATEGEALGQASTRLSALAEHMAESAASSSNGTGIVSESVRRVSRSVEGISSAAVEMHASIKEIAKSANEAAQLVQTTAEAERAASDTVNKLGDSSTQIEKVIKMIAAIAEQTNLLALNATIEAARAGEAGKGFAVVAGEVKNLASQSATATDEISSRIDAIQSDSRAAVAAISQIGEHVTRVNEAQSSIAAALEQQSATTNEISRNVAEASQESSGISATITNVATLAERTSADAQETREAAEQLGRTATQLDTLIGQFRFDHEPRRVGLAGRSPAQQVARRLAA
jgi:methyl-accepting chemotaxis protein